MTKKQLVICCRADKRCYLCIHSEPHEVEVHKQYGSCTKWDECHLYSPDEIRKVRCTKVKDK